MPIIREDRAWLKDKSWDEKAKINPLYAVMAVEEFVESGPIPTQEELDIFYESGEKKVNKWIYPWLLETDTQKDMKILEFGCGMGRLLRSLEKYHPPENLYGIDISQTMISRAREHLHKDVHLELISDHGSWPFPDNHFDRIFSYAVFQHISRKSAVIHTIREISRTLNVGGEAKLHFSMLFPPPLGNRKRKDTFAFESFSIIHGWSNRFIVPIWGFRIAKSNNWTGIRMGYGQLLKEFRENNIEIYGIRREPPSAEFVWFFGKKNEEGR